MTMPTEEQRKPAFDMRKDGEAFCATCPDHEACFTGWPCWKVREVEDKSRYIRVVMQREPDGSWVEATPVPFKGWKASVEQWALAWRFPRLARFMGRWDERTLGK